MKERNLKALILSAGIFAFALIISVVLMLVNGRDASPNEGESSSENETEHTSDILPAVTTDSYSYIIDVSEYASALNTRDGKYKLLANKQNPLGEDFVPSVLVTLDTSITLYEKQLSLEENAALAAAALIAEMRAAGFSDIYITSAYRSYAYQKQLFDNYYQAEKENHPSWSDEQIKEKVLTYSAAPGTSEHQTGLCMDLFVSPGMTDLVNYGNETSDHSNDVGFAETAEFRWLKENAHKFGFILRYPDGKESETGYDYESWHYRFVGVDLATKIKNSNLTFESYLQASK